MTRPPGIDELPMQIDTNLFTLFTLAVAGSVLVLYIMRRRVRLGRRVPKF